MDNKTIKISALKQRADDLSFLLIEAEGEEYFSYATELEHVEYEIDQLETELTETMDIFNNEGML